ncbi:hypothetical protein B0H15DRAFT_813332 [Mycena belliarum]|uniref:Uncharacterized protein n=1 Tax=Mycena belliarum TaxID=1033014 RepID=A0AAD6XYL4_9AGAR|nr:hypothetical protein B0H15DRAFT_813332 [Mycena belliae]
MPDDSDTESESGSHEPSVVLFSEPVSSVSGEFEAISNAMKEIRNIELGSSGGVGDVEAILKDTMTLRTISEASTMILTFLNCIQRTPMSPEYPRQALADFAELSSASFLTVLFDHRKLFHKIAAQSSGLEPGSSAALVCWVDSIISKLGDASITVATGISWNLKSSLFPGSPELRSEECLRAASQMPSDWTSVAGIVSSHEASPAAKRLALRLTFSAFVLAPRLCRRTPPSNLPDIGEILDQCVNQTRTTGFSASFAGEQLAIQERLNFAMILSLFVVADCERQNNVNQALSLRPHTLGCLLDMLQHIIHPNESVSSLQLTTPPDVLDPAQTVILCWGDTVSWCWETWDDHRVANAESIVFLTSMWLLHSDKPFLPVMIASQPNFTTASTASSLAFLRVLHHTMLSLSTGFHSRTLPLITTTVVSGACYHALKSLKHLLSRQEEGERWIVSNLCKSLLSIFVFLTGETDEELDVTDYILEALSLVDLAILHTCLKHSIMDTRLSFPARLDERVIRAHNTLAVGGNPTRNLNVLRSVLNFATLVWSSQTTGCLLPQSSSRLLSAAVEFLLQHNSPSLPSKTLGGAVLTASAAARGLLPEVNRESLWRLAITSAPSELDIAGELWLDVLGLIRISIEASFAQYIFTSNDLCNALYCAEAWRYLGEVLLLILKHHYDEEQEPLALLTCPTVCAALLRLLQADFATSKTSTSIPTELNAATPAQFMLFTPFTLNLSADLKSACDATRSEEYFVIMRERLNSIGARLLDQIACKSGRTAHDSSQDAVPMRLVFYRIYGAPHLTFVPDP